MEADGGTLAGELIQTYSLSMRITVEISESDVRDICRVTGEKKKGTAIQQIVADALRLRRRAELLKKYARGEGTLEFAGFEEGRKKDRERDELNRKRWRK